RLCRGPGCSRGAAEIAKIRVGATGRSPVLWTNRIDATNRGATERRATCRSPLQNSRISASSAAPRANATANDVKCDSPALREGQGEGTRAAARSDLAIADARKYAS